MTEFVYAGVCDSVRENLVVCVSDDYETVHNAMCLFPDKDRYIITYPINKMVTAHNHKTKIRFEQGEEVYKMEVRPTTEKKYYYVTYELLQDGIVLTKRIATDSYFDINACKEGDVFIIKLEMDKVYDYKHTIPRVVFSYSKQQRGKPVKSLFALSYEAVVQLGQPLPDYLEARYKQLFF